MKKSNKIMAMLLAVVMLVSILPANVMAKSDRGTIILTDKNGEDIYVYNASYGTQNVSGMSYSVKTNTLTIKNFNIKDSILYVDNMGKDFKIDVKGNNSIEEIVVRGIYDDAASVRFTGAGSIRINEDRKSSVALSADCCYGGKNSIIIDPTVVLKAYSKGENSSHSLEIYDSVEKTPLKANCKCPVIEEEHYLQEKLDMLFYMDEENWAEEMYKGTIKSSGQKCLVKELGDEYAVTIDFEEIENNVCIISPNAGYGFIPKANINKELKVDFKKACTVYDAGRGPLNAKLDSKNGKGRYYTSDFDPITVYKISDKTYFGIHAAIPYEVFEGDNAREEYEKAGYAPIMTNVKAKTLTVSADYSTVRSFGSIKSVSLKAKKKGFTVKYNKVDGAKKYEIRYSVKKNMAKAKKVTSKSTVCTVKKLKKKTKYYVQVRAVCDGLKSTWSKVKTVKTY